MLVSNINFITANFFNEPKYCKRDVAIKNNKIPRTSPPK